MEKERLKGVWNSIKQRCYNQKSSSFMYYGGRGITMCDEWRNNYNAFKEWAMANGYDEHAEHGECTIDRIDVNGNYEPNNCRWVSMTVQARNKRPYQKRMRLLNERRAVQETVAEQIKSLMLTAFNISMDLATKLTEIKEERPLEIPLLIPPLDCEIIDLMGRKMFVALLKE